MRQRIRAIIAFIITAVFFQLTPSNRSSSPRIYWYPFTSTTRLSAGRSGISTRKMDWFLFNLAVCFIASDSLITFEYFFKKWRQGDRTWIIYVRNPFSLMKWMEKVKCKESPRTNTGIVTTAGKFSGHDREMAYDASLHRSLKAQLPSTSWPQSQLSCEKLLSELTITGP